MVAVMRNNPTRKTCPCIYILGDSRCQDDSRQLWQRKNARRHCGGEESHVSDGYDRCCPCAGVCWVTSILRILRAAENTTAASYRGTCVEMYAYYSSVTVSYFRYLILNTVFDQLHCRGCRKKHNRHFSDQGVFRLPGSLQYAPLRNGCLIDSPRFNMLCQKLPFPQKLRRKM